MTIKKELFNLILDRKCMYVCFCILNYSIQVLHVLLYCYLHIDYFICQTDVFYRIIALKPNNLK